MSQVDQVATPVNPTIASVIAPTPAVVVPPVADPKAEVKADEQATDVTPAVAAVEDADVTPPADAEGEGEPEAEEGGKKKGGLDKRFAKMTREREAAKTEAAYWKGVAEGKTPAVQSATVAQSASAPQGKPTLVDYNGDVEKYTEAVSRWTLQQHEAVRTENDAIRAHNTRAATFVAAHPDYQETLENVNHIKFPMAAMELMRDSEVGPELAYYYGNNVEEAERLEKLPPYRILAELGKLEAKLVGAKTKPTTPKPAPKIVPAPVTPVKGNVPAAAKPVHEMSAQEYNTYLYQQTKAKREAKKAGRK